MGTAGRVKAKDTIRIAALAGFAGDRVEPAVEALRKGGVQYGVFECLAERTIALRQQEKRSDARLGYDPMLRERMKMVMPIVRENGVKIITNMGAANPLSAAKVVGALANGKLKVAAVVGDDVFGRLGKYEGYSLQNEGRIAQRTVGGLPNKVSANAYLGADGVVSALKRGADIIITGRVADSSLFLAPAIYEFGWNANDYGLIGKGLVAGHLLECGAQVTGGYYADPGYKNVPGLWNTGFPIAEVSRDGAVTVTKSKGTGGMVTVGTCTEQLLYEIHDPARYITPDGIADFSHVTFEQLGSDKILVKGATAREKTGMLKVSIGYMDGYMAEGEISYGGTGAYERAELAGRLVKRWLRQSSARLLEGPRIDLIGYNSLYGDRISRTIGAPAYSLSEVRLRVAAKAPDVETAKLVGHYVEALYTNGPAAGGGVRTYVKENIAVASTLIPRKDVKTRVVMERA